MEQLPGIGLGRAVRFVLAQPKARAAHRPVEFAERAELDAAALSHHGEQRPRVCLRFQDMRRRHRVLTRATFS